LYLEVIRADAHIYGLDCDEKGPVLYILHLSEWLGFHLEFICADVHISGANRKPRGQEWLHPNHSLRPNGTPGDTPCKTTIKEELPIVR
jgi:hypothetical protein